MTATIRRIRSNSGEMPLETLDRILEVIPGEPAEVVVKVRNVDYSPIADQLEAALHGLKVEEPSQGLDFHAYNPSKDLIRRMYSAEQERQAGYNELANKFVKNIKAALKHEMKATAGKPTVPTASLIIAAWSIESQEGNRGTRIVVAPFSGVDITYHGTKPPYVDALSAICSEADVRISVSDNPGRI